MRLSIRRALGLRRSWRQKVLPWSLLGIVTIPAVINVGVKYITRNTPAADVEIITYRDYVGVSTTLLLFVAITAPDMICPDRRKRVLPLIFARPLTGNDYVLAKVGALTAILFGFGFLPQVVLFVGHMLVVEEGALDYLKDNVDVLWQVPVAVALFSLYWATLALALVGHDHARIVGGVARSPPSSSPGRCRRSSSPRAVRTSRTSSRTAACGGSSTCWSSRSASPTSCSSATSIPRRSSAGPRERASA